MSSKRKESWIDLTGSSDTEKAAPARKYARVSPSHHHNHRHHPASSSQPSSSQSLHARPPAPRLVWDAGHDEENEIIDLSQDVDEGEGWLCVGAIDAKIVGVRYYEGYATANETVIVRREPGNPYDSNAIRINNVHGTQIGHIAR